MKLNSDVSLDSRRKELLNPVYEEKTISILVRALVRFIDIIAGLVGILMLIPLSLYIIIEKNVKKEAGPIFYSEERMGKNGRIFNMYRINTNSIIAEFPQFINILVGDMTLVGPRPYFENQRNDMGAYYNVITSVRPGITGIFQISGRDMTMGERLYFDSYYVFNRSFKLYMKIILITTFVTVRNKEARYYKKYLYTEIPREVVGNFITRGIRNFVKRVIDIICSLIGCIFMIPLALIIKIAYLVSGDTHSIFYSQERIGKDGKIFKILKFRTMVADADEVLEELMEKNSYIKEEWQVYHKIEDDPRITKVGKFLRETSLDEVPQIINILKGDMSIIGNRPYMIKEKEAMGDYYLNIVKTKPGLTGVWQTSGRSEITFDERLVLENDYSNNYTLLLDIKLFFKTIGVVLKRTGSK